MDVNPRLLTLRFQRYQLKLAIVFTFFFTLGALVASAEPPKGTLVIVGAGSPEGLCRKVIDLSGKTNANVLVIPFASGLHALGTKVIKQWREAGVVQVSAPSADDATAALAAIRAADVIWFTGGGQAGLMKVLRQLNLVEAIRERYAQGAIIGGASAGAAVMSKVMMLSHKPKTSDEPQPTGEGLGLWPEVIVDVHFSQRKHLPRLQSAVATHPDLIGVGIDEDTYAVLRGKKAEVFGQGTVTLVDAREGKTKLKVRVLKAGARFDLAASTSN